MFLSRVEPSNKRSDILELEAGTIVWAINLLRPDYIGTYCLSTRDHHALGNSIKNRFFDGRSS